MKLIDVKGHISGVSLSSSGPAKVEITVRTGYQQSSAIVFEFPREDNARLVGLIDKTIRMTIEVET